MSAISLLNTSKDLPMSKRNAGATIQDFYSNKSIFVTGVTGFLGSVFVEKLLYSCEKLKTIYVLIRKKKGKEVEERFEEFKNSPIFQRIRNEKPEMLKKLFVLPGNVCEINLGLSQKDRELLRGEVSLVFHIAADVNFDISLKEAVIVNTIGTQQILQLCKELALLQAFVYVSTAYSNCNRKVISEKVYPIICSLDSVKYVVENSSNNNITSNILDNRPNSYTFVKALAEEVISNERGDIPTAIVRPSVIISSVKEPVKGWIEGWNGATGVIAAIGHGLVRSWHGDPEAVADLIPVDMVSNLTIAAAWGIHKRDTTGDNLSIYNCCSGLQNPITVKMFLETCLYYTRKHLFDGVLIYPTLLVTKLKFLHLMTIFFLQTIPAYIIDNILWILGRKVWMQKMQRQLGKLSDLLVFFTLHQFLFIDENVHDLYDSLSSQEKEIFDFNVRNYGWEEYLENYILGIKKHLLKKK